MGPKSTLPCTANEGLDPYGATDAADADAEAKRPTSARLRLRRHKRLKLVKVAESKTPSRKVERQQDARAPLPRDPELMTPKEQPRVTREPVLDVVEEIEPAGKTVIPPEETHPSPQLAEVKAEVTRLHVEEEIHLSPQEAEAKAEATRLHAEDKRDEMDWHGSIQAYSEVVDLLPGDASARMSRGQCFGMTGEFDLAISDFTKAVELKPDSAEALQCRAWCNMKKDDYTAAISDFSKALQFNAEMVNAFVGRGRCHHTTGALDLAIADFTSAISLDPESANAFLGRGRSFRKKGGANIKRAIADFTEAISLDPPNVSDAFVGRGRSYCKEGSFEEAIVDFSAAIRDDEDFVDAWRYRGRTYQRIGDDEKAIFNLSQVIKLGVGQQQHLHDAYLDRGWSYYRSEKFGNATSDFTEAIRLDPESALAYGSRGSSNEAKGEFRLAIVDYSAAIRLDATDSATFCNRGTCYTSEGDLDSAIEDFGKAISLDETNLDALQQRGSLLVAKESFDKAFIDFSAAIVIEPTAHLHVLRGIVCLLQANADEALQDFELADELDPDDVVRNSSCRALAFWQRRELDEVEIEIAQVYSADSKFEWLIEQMELFPPVIRLGRNLLHDLKASSVKSALEAALKGIPE